MLSLERTIIDEYVVEQLSLYQIGKRHRIHPFQVKRILTKYGHATRNHSQAQKLSLAKGVGRANMTGRKQTQDARAKIAAAMRKRHKEKKDAGDG